MFFMASSWGEHRPPKGWPWFAGLTRDGGFRTPGNWTKPKPRFQKATGFSRTTRLRAGGDTVCRLCMSMFFRPGESWGRPAAVPRGIWSKWKCYAGRSWPDPAVPGRAAYIVRGDDVENA